MVANLNNESSERHYLANSERSLDLTAEDINEYFPLGFALRYGDRFNGIDDDHTAIQRTLDVVDADHTGISGYEQAVARLPGKLARISQKIIVPNFVMFEGISGRGTKIQPMAGYTDDSMIEFADAGGAESLFDSGLRKMWIDASVDGTSGTTIAAITDVVRSRGLQENCSIDQFIISSFDTRGLTFDPGNGAAHMQIKRGEIGPNDGGIGISCNSTGVTAYLIERVTINGDPSTTTIGLDLLKDNAILTACHFEDCGIGARLAASTSITGFNCKGLDSTVSLFQVADASARLELFNCSPNGAAKLVDNLWSGFDITRPVRHYSFPDELNASNDDTPSVLNDPEIITLTGSSGTTVLTGFDDSYNGQKFTVVFLITTGQYDVDFTSSSLKGNGGADWIAVSDGDSMEVTMRNGIGHCQISG